MVNTTTDNSGRRSGAVAALWALVILWVLALVAVASLLFGGAT